MPTRLKVDVTQELIDDATQRDSRRCMIAEAIKAAHPEYRKILVDLATIRWTNPRTKKRYVCLTPEAAGFALVAFDQGEKVDPFAFSITPVQVTPVRIHEVKPTNQLPLDDTGKPTRKSGSAYRQRSSRGRKVIDPVSGTITGGQPLPTGHLSNVQVSRNDVRVYGRRLLRG